MATFCLPLRVRLLTRLFRHCFPLYRTLYFSYKYYSDRHLCQFFRQQLLQRTNKPTCNILDIGANIGFFTRFFAHNAPSHAKILAFEPEPTNFKHLLQEIKHYPAVQAYSAAVTETSGEVELVLSAASSIDHHIGVHTDEQVQDNNKITVPSVSIDDICVDLPQIDIIKMDIQGAECHALRGMKNTLSRSPDCVIVMELWPWGFRRGGDSYATFFDIIASYGLKAHAFDADKRDLQRFCAEHADNAHAYTNIFVANAP